jgi:hypothetical protein
VSHGLNIVSHTLISRVHLRTVASKRGC